MSGISSKSWKRSEVRCLDGYRANERPLSFLLGDNEIKVRTVLESWREPDWLCFRVDTDDGGIYELRHHEYEDFWQARESTRLDNSKKVKGP